MRFKLIIVSKIRWKKETNTITHFGNFHTCQDHTEPLHRCLISSGQVLSEATAQHKDFCLYFSF